MKCHNCDSNGTTAKLKLLKMCHVSSKAETHQISYSGAIIICPIYSSASFSVALSGWDNNTAINVTGRGKGGARKAELQDRKMAHADQYRAGRRHNATQMQAREQTTGEGRVRRTQQQSTREGREREKGDKNMSVCTKPELQNGARAHG